MGSGPGMRLQVVHLRKNYGVKNPSELHIPSENIVGGYLFTRVAVLRDLESFVFTFTRLQLSATQGWWLIVRGRGTPLAYCHSGRDGLAGGHTKGDFPLHAAS